MPSTAAFRRLRAGLLGAVAAAALAAPLAAAPAPLAPAPVTAPVQAAPGFADAVAKVMPAVVNISTTRAAATAQVSGLPEAPAGSPMEELMRRFFEQQQRRAPGGKTQALGSGFVVDPAGYVVTNNHVIDDASEILVVLADGSRLPAKLIGSDDKTDLALLKVEAGRPLPAVEFGDSDAARVGDWVIAVGNPFGLGGTVTAGILSARGRDLDAGPYDDFLQIDAPINPGNSGGPTFDASGRVIGVNTAISSPNGGSVGIGFAVPAAIARDVVAQLREHGRVERAWLGVSIQPVTPELARAVELEQPKGALVASVDPKSPAAKAGLKGGDVILAFDGKEVSAAHDLPRLVAQSGAGSSAQIAVWRDGARHELTAALAPMPEPRQAAAAKPAAAEHGLGMQLGALTQPARRELGIPDAVKGVLVTEVKPGSAAAETGIRPGDIIQRVGRKQVAEPHDVAQAVREARAEKRPTVLVLVNRGGREQFVALPVA